MPFKKNSNTTADTLKGKLFTCFDDASKEVNLQDVHFATACAHWLAQAKNGEPSYLHYCFSGNEVRPAWEGNISEYKTGTEPLITKIGAGKGSRSWCCCSEAKRGTPSQKLTSSLNAYGIGISFVHRGFEQMGPRTPSGADWNPTVSDLKLAEKIVNACEDAVRYGPPELSE